MGEQYKVLGRPTMEEALTAIREGISGHRNVVIVGNCWADYFGRASSKLEPGERILLIKSDGSTLIHRPRDYSPVNWQPPGSLFRTRIREGNLCIRVFRRKGRESLELTFDRLYLVALLHLVDLGEFYLYASEKDMHDAILLDPSLVEQGFHPAMIERPVESGFVDILGFDATGRFTVVEVKRKAIGREAVLQLERYVEALKKNTGREVRGILIGPSISKGIQGLLATLNLEFKPLSPRKCAEALVKKGRKMDDFPLGEKEEILG